MNDVYKLLMKKIEKEAKRINKMGYWGDSYYCGYEGGLKWVLHLMKEMEENEQMDGIQSQPTH